MQANTHTHTHRLARTLKCSATSIKCEIVSPDRSAHIRQLVGGLARRGSLTFLFFFKRSYINLFFARHLIFTAIHLAVSPLPLTHYLLVENFQRRTEQRYRKQIIWFKHAVIFKHIPVERVKKCKIL